MPGFERGRQLEKIGMHAQDTAELSFTDVRVPAANMLGAEGDGFLGLTRNLAQERCRPQPAAVAGRRGRARADRRLRARAPRLRQRRSARCRTPASRSPSCRPRSTSRECSSTAASLALNAGELTPVDAAKAKWWSTELLGRVVDTGVQLHGGYGYMAEYPIAKAWADARVQRIYAGTTEIMKDLIGRSMRLA